MRETATKKKACNNRFHVADHYSIFFSYTSELYYLRFVCVHACVCLLAKYSMKY